MTNTQKTMFADTTMAVMRSHRPNETADRYADRLRSARLRKDERAEIAAYYAAIDAERAANGLPPAQRAPWSPADILEFRDLKPGERYRDLEIYARACDRLGTTPPRPMAA